MNINISAYGFEDGKSHLRDVATTGRGVLADDVPVNRHRRGRRGAHQGGGPGDLVSEEVGLVRSDLFVSERVSATPAIVPESQQRRASMNHANPPVKGPDEAI